MFSAIYYCTNDSKITVKSTLNKEKYNHKSDDGKNDSLKSALSKLKRAIQKRYANG